MSGRQDRRSLFSADTRTALLELLEADRALMLAERLYEDGGGLERLLKGYSREVAMGAIKGVLGRAIIGGTSGKVRDWGYFRSAIEEELARMRARAEDSH